MLGAFVILFGVAVFSIINGEFLDLITEIRSISAQQTDDEQLEIFFVALKWFNDKKVLKRSMIDDITDYFKFKWENDKNNFLETNEDYKILNNLTIKEEKTVVELYTKFIYRNVLKRFNRFFMIRREDVPTGTVGKSVYQNYHDKTFRQLFKENQHAYLKDTKIDLLGQYFPFYSYNDQIYLLFMTRIFRSLEIRKYDEGVYLARELDECHEILFVDEGFYKVGFQVNNTEYLRLIFGKSTCIGAYNAMFMVRHELLYKSITHMFCFAIRKSVFDEIFTEIP